MPMHMPDDAPFLCIDPNSGSPFYRHKKAQRDDWSLDSHDPQGYSQDMDKIDAQSRQVFSISMAGYQDGRKDCPTP